MWWPLSLSECYFRRLSKNREGFREWTIFNLMPYPTLIATLRTYDHVAYLIAILVLCLSVIIVYDNNSYAEQSARWSCWCWWRWRKYKSVSNTPLWCVVHVSVFVRVWFSIAINFTLFKAWIRTILNNVNRSIPTCTLKGLQHSCIRQRFSHNCQLKPHTYTYLNNVL